MWHYAGLQLLGLRTPRYATLRDVLRLGLIDMDEMSGIGGGLANYDSPQGYIGKATMTRIPTLKERIALAVTQAQDKLAAVREAQEIFDRNPDLERLLNLMQKNHF